MAVWLAGVTERTGVETGKKFVLIAVHGADGSLDSVSPGRNVCVGN